MPVQSIQNAVALSDLAFKANAEVKAGGPGSGRRPYSSEDAKQSQNAETVLHCYYVSLNHEGRAAEIGNAPGSLQKENTSLYRLHKAAALEHRDAANTIAYNGSDGLDDDAVAEVSHNANVKSSEVNKLDRIRQSIK